MYVLSKWIFHTVSSHEIDLESTRFSRLGSCRVLPQENVLTWQTIYREGLILKLYPGIKTTTFVPQHAQDRLSKDFRCYANFECSTWSWR